MQRARLPIISAVGFAAMLLVASVGTVAADTGPGLTIPPAVASANAPTVTISPTARLVNGVVATVHIDVVCQPMPSEWDPSLDPTIGHTEGTSATIIQAIGKKALAEGQGEAFGNAFVCDGSTVNPLDITVVTQTVPFRKGSAAMGVSFQVCNADCSAWAYRSSGPISVTLTSK